MGSASGFTFSSYVLTLRRRRRALTKVGAWQWLFSAVLLGLTGTRLHYTLFLPPYDPLNNGQAFYDPIAVELLATSVLALFWSSFMCVFVLSCPGLCPVRVMLTLCAESTSSTEATTMAASRLLRASSSASLCSSSCS